MKHPRFKSIILGRPGRLVFGLLLSLVTLYFSFRSVSLQQIEQILSQTYWAWVLIAIIIFIINNLIKSYRWQVLIGPSSKDIGFFPILSALLISQMINFIVPAKLGEISRLQQVGGKGPGRSFVLGTVVIEKVVDMLAYVLIFFALLLSMPLPDWITGTGILFLSISVLFIIIFSLVVYYPERVQKPVFYLIEKLPIKLSLRIRSGYERILGSLVQLRKGKILGLTLFTTLLVWISSILVNLLLFNAVRIPLGWQAAMVLLLALQAVISIPSLPGRIGIFEFTCILSLGLFGVDQVTALSYGLVLHVVVLLPILISGTLLLATQKDTS